MNGDLENAEKEYKKYDYEESKLTHHTNSEELIKYTSYNYISSFILLP